MSADGMTVTLRRSLWLGGAVAAASFAFAPAWAADIAGKEVALGKGTAQVVVSTDAGGQPTSVAISLTESALDGLPTELNPASGEGGYAFTLPMPEGVSTGFQTVMIDWNPHGHPPPDVYTVPHFDFHFYTIPADQIQAITFSGPDDAAAKVADNALVAADYQVIPDTAINMMGVHAIDMTSPELHGTPFTATFIYGYDKGQLIFVEPMVTLAYLKTNPDATMPVKTPEHYSSPGFYPTNYSVKFDAANKRYLIELGGLKNWK